MATADIIDDFVTAYETSLTSNTTAGVFYGNLIALEIVFIYMIFPREGLKKPSAPRRVLFLLSLAMFTSSTIFFALRLALDATVIHILRASATQNSEASDHLWRKYNQMSIASAVFGSLNYFFSDAVVVWRAWVLVNRQCRIVLSILMIGSTAALASMIASDLPIPNSVFGSMAVTTTAILLPFLLTNVVATMMIGYKFWHHRQALRNSSQLPDNLIAEQISEPQNEVQKILLIIVESGFLYLILWTFALIAESGALGPYAMFIEKTFLPHLAAIYPLLVFLLVACQKSEISMLAQRSKARA